MIMALMTEPQLKKITGIEKYSGVKPKYTKMEKKFLYHNGEYIIGGSDFGYDKKLFKEAETLAKSLGYYEIMFPDIPSPCVFKCDNNIPSGKPIYVVLAPRVNDSPEDYEWSESIDNLKKRLGVNDEKRKDDKKTA
jgi:hypothetical protein